MVTRHVTEILDESIKIEYYFKIGTSILSWNFRRCGVPKITMYQEGQNIDHLGI
jgi:hypothetical protein